MLLFHNERSTISHDDASNRYENDVNECLVEIATVLTFSLMEVIKFSFQMFHSLHFIVMSLTTIYVCLMHQHDKLVPLTPQIGEF